MKKRKFSFLFSLLILSSCYYQITPITWGEDVDPFAFEGNFENSELNIDGLKLEEQWNEGEYTTGEYIFTYKNYLSNEPYQYSFIIYRGIKELFIFFKVFDCNIVTYGNDGGSSVSFSDGCELYLDTNLDRASKPQNDDFQINLGVHGKTRILRGNGSGWSAWNGIVQYESYVVGTINNESDIDQYYCIEMSISYKQIGITRNQEIGVTCGIVDRYMESGGSTNKKWYGTTINGHFGNPQDPSTYFILGKNTLSLPPVPEYIASEDHFPYASNIEMKIPATTYNEENFEEITYHIGREGSRVTALATTENKWPEFEGICFSFDFGNPLRGSRDQNTIIIRAYPGARSFLDFYRYPNIGLNKCDLDFKVNEYSAYVSFDFTPFQVEGYEKVNFCASSIYITGNVTVKVLQIGTNTLNQSELHTYGQLSLENQVELPENTQQYNPVTDTTSYIPNTNLHLPAQTLDGEELATKTFKVSRVNQTLTILCQNADIWSPSELIMLCFDFGAPTRTTRDSTTAILRFSPKKGVLRDLFFYSNIVQSKACVQASYYQKDTKLVIEITPLIENIEAYTDYGVGFAAAVCRYDNQAVLGYCYNGEKQLDTNPSLWLRLSATNTVI
ncbi:MAG: sugar-binding protein [Bacilli bacterium]